MTTETHSVAMTDPQLSNNNNNNNNDGEPKYLHKKFKKMATTEVTPKVEPKKDTGSNIGSSEETKKKDSTKDPKESLKDPIKVEVPLEPADGEPTESRKSGYVCPYCRLSCAKPSVLQKHIRAHTNERPYPCVPCGFAFKTKSNLYKHCRSRAHALKMEGGDTSKVSEDSDISLSDSASNGTGTPPPPPSSTPTTIVTTVKTIKTGKIYKPKFHTALQCVNNDTETSSLSSTSSTNSSSSTSAIATSKLNPEQVQEHINKIITDNQVIVDAVDPCLHKLIQRQQSLVEIKQSDQPLNLTSAEESLSRKRCYSESFIQENKDCPNNSESSVIKDLVLKNQNSSEEGTVEKEEYLCPSCDIPYSSIDNLDAHRKYYCRGSVSPRREYQIEFDKRESEFDTKSSDYYNTLQPLPSPGPLLGNTRLVDAYAPPMKKQKPESVPTTLRSLEELSKYPRPNSLQMFGGEVRILDNSGETKTMRIEPRQTNSPTSEHIVSTNCATSETASIVVRSGLHSGGTMLHKPPSTPTSTPSSSISLPNTPKMLAPIIPNISTPNITPSMSCYNYLEPHLNPLTTITAYNPLTLPQPGITSILHGGKVIPYVPGMPGPHTLTPTMDISSSIVTGDTGYKVIPGLPGLHTTSQPLDLASPVKIQAPNIPGIPGPISTSIMGQPLDLASPAKDSRFGYKTPPGNDILKPGFTSSKVPSVKIETSTEKYRRIPSTSESNKTELDRHIKNNVSNKYRSIESPRERAEFLCERSSKVDKTFSYGNNSDSDVASSNSCSKLKYSPKESTESRKRLSTWNITELETCRMPVESSQCNAIFKYDSPPPIENGRLKGNLTENRGKMIENYNVYNGAKLEADSVPSMVLANQDTPKTEVPSKSSMDIVKADEREVKSPKNNEVTTEEINSNKFLRPTSLPLKPGTFTPKKHHGITPTANTLPLISPETPRPKKSYGQLYLNGHAYTYLGLKCSTRVFYCTLNRPQPMYVTQQHGLSMYSNWKICKESPSDVDMVHYDSRHRPLNYTTAWKKQDDILTHSSQRPTTPTSADSEMDSDMQEKAKRIKIFEGGFESNEDYTYVRGRGRGRYVCDECGIRCKKPSMLKKHIRTHTDVRPYTCKHCAFSFKTKGNLTKHMKSKAHYKKCIELAILPVPTTVCDDNIDKEAIARLAAGDNTEDSSEEEEESEGEESEESGSEEQEAAQSLLSLSQRNTNILPGLLPSGRPTTYPYSLTFSVSSPPSSVSITITNTRFVNQDISTQGTTLVRNDLSYRYYFPSSRNVPEEPRTTVIQSSKKENSKLEVEVIDTDSRNNLSQPMDLTTKSTVQSLPSPILQRAKPTDILTPVSEPILLQTIVQTMERLPIQGREWKPDAEGHMLQAYLTERHVMDSKIKQQYRVGNTKMERQPNERDNIYSRQPSPRSRSIESNNISTVTYVDSKIQQTVMDSRILHISKHNTDDVKMDISEQIYQNNVAMERLSFDIESIHKDKEQENRTLSENENFEHTTLIDSVNSKTSMEYDIVKGNNCADRGATYSAESPSRSTPQNVECHSPKSYNIDTNNRLLSMSRLNNDNDKNIVLNSKRTMNELERARECHVVNQEMRPTSHEMRNVLTDLRMQSQSPRNLDMRPPSREMRALNQDYRGQLQELRPPNQDYKLCRPELRPPSREFKPPNHDIRSNPDVVSSSNIEMRHTNGDNRPPSNEILLSEYRHTQAQEQSINYEIMSLTMHEASKIQDVSRRPTVDVRNVDRIEVKHTEMAKQNMVESIKHTVARKMVVGGPGFRSPSPTAGGTKPQAEFLQPSSGPTPNYVSVTEDGRSVCGICNKVFSKPSQLRLHINIHYFERPFRCESCAVSFRTKGHLTKHERSVSHHNKVSMTSTFGAATTSNPRPFKCTDCKIAFRIHGHLAKHLRSKMHIMKLECLGKLPFGTYAEMERSGINLNDIDTTDCDNSLTSLQMLAQRLCEKDSSKIGQWDPETIPNQIISGGETSSDEGEPIPQHAMHPCPVKVTDAEMSRSYHVPIANEDSKSDVLLGNSQFNQQRREYSMKEKPNQQATFSVEDSKVDESIQSYKCQVCTVSMRTMNELQVHCFVEHNIESDSSTNIHGDRNVNMCREKENTQKIIMEEFVVKEDQNRQKAEDT